MAFVDVDPIWLVTACSFLTDWNNRLKISSFFFYIKDNADTFKKVIIKNANEKSILGGKYCPLIE